MAHLYEIAMLSEKKIRDRITQLENSLNAFTHITNIPCSYYSNEGIYCWSNRPGKRVCDFNSNYNCENSKCNKSLQSSFSIACGLPDVYIFMCNSSLTNLCCTISLEDHLYGFIIAGPIAMGKNMERVLDTFSVSSAAESVDYARILGVISRMNLYEPKDVSCLATLFKNVMDASLGSSITDNLRYQQYLEQAEICQEIIEIKKDHKAIEYPADTEAKLLDAIKSGSPDSQKLFSNFMESLMIYESGNLPVIKVRLIAFFTQLLKGIDEWNQYEGIYLLENINEALTLKEFMQAGKALVDTLTENAASASYSGSSQIIKKALAFLQQHYMESISLTNTANRLHVNGNYLSTLFKREMGITFSVYLNNIRLEHCEELLTTTNLSITEICLETGFSSSSYFTKLFRNKNKMTPSAWRRQTRNTNSNGEIMKSLI